MAIKKAPRIHTFAQDRDQTSPRRNRYQRRLVAVYPVASHHSCFDTTTTTTAATTTYHHAPFLYLVIPSGLIVRTSRTRRLAGATLELLSEENELHLIVDGQDTGTGDTTENVGTSSLEERAGTLNSDDLTEGIEGRLVLDGLEKVSGVQ
jgi:hypothetical protein